jgi:HlyD family secretion protein
MRRRVRSVISVVLVAAVVLAFWYATSRRGALPPGRIPANGTIETTEVDVTARIAAKVVALPFREGDSVRAGEFVVALDDSDLRAALQQAEEARRAAQASLDELLAGTRLEEIARARAQYQAAREARQQAQARLDLVKAGPRVEEVEQLRAAVRQAEVSLRTAETELVRTKGLAEKGALPTQQVDLLQAQRDVAAAQLDAARQRLLQAERGARLEDLHAAQAAVAQADSQAEAARAALDLALAGPRPETIAAARARVAQAEAAVQAAKVQLGYTRITSPLDGTVTLRNLEPGELVIPGLPILRIAALDRVWLRVFISETDLGRVKHGQRAAVTTDTYPNQQYRGRVIEIAEEAEFTPRNVQTREERQKLVFGVKIEVENPKHELKPGMPADATIAVGEPEP